jgi:hypothetical protein
VDSVDTDPTAIDAWQRQSVWSRAANQAKQSIERARALSLGLVIAAAVLGAADPLVAKAGHRFDGWCALAAGLALGLLPIVRSRIGKGSLQSWVRLRATSEALKTEIYTYLAGTAPYRDDAAEGTLHDRVAGIVGRVNDLLPRTVGIESAERPLPAVHDIPSYLEFRVADQVDGYYRKKAAETAGNAAWIRRIQVALAVAAVALGVIATTHQAGLGPWVGVVGTISGAVIAHGSAARNEFLELEYLRTAQQLGWIVNDYKRLGASDDAAADALVTQCERVISIQNDGWMAELVTVRDADADPHIPAPRADLPRIDG